MSSFSLSSSTPSSSSFSYSSITHWVKFVLPTYSWVWDHPFEHGQPTRSCTLKANQFSPRSYQLVVNSSWARHTSPLPPLTARVWSGLILCGQAQLLGVHECICPVISRRHCFSLVLPYVCLLQFFYPFFWDGPQALWSAEWYICLTRGLTLYSHIFCVVNFCITCHPLHKENFFIRFESCTNLWVWREDTMSI